MRTKEVSGLKFFPSEMIEISNSRHFNKIKLLEKWKAIFHLKRILKFFHQDELNHMEEISTSVEEEKKICSSSNSCSSLSCNKTSCKT